MGRHKPSFSLVEAILIIALSVVMMVGILGYIANGYKLVTECGWEAPSYKCEWIRTIGVFIPPVGAVVGYITIGE